MTNQLLEGLFATYAPPTDDKEWTYLDIRAQDLFTPHAAINDAQLFAGRFSLIERLIEVVFQDGQHAIVFGDRGVGKSSLANILKDRIFTKSSTVKTIKRNCTVDHTFKLIWQHVFDDFNYDGVPAPTWLEANHNPFDVHKLVNGFETNERPVIIIDEFDRVEDARTKVLMADTIKYLSDYNPRATVILVGVAEDVAKLFSGHKSIPRSLEQIQMPRMEPQELLDILNIRLVDLRMNMESSTKDQIVSLSQGFPGFTHLLGQATCRAAIKRRSIKVTDFDLQQAIPVVIEKSHATIKEAYAKAVRSSKPNNQYKQVLLACARAQADERGYFNAASVCDPLSKIVQRRREIPSFARHLNEFCHPDRGPALIKEGSPKNYQYRFADALVRPYAHINGIRAGL